MAVKTLFFPVALEKWRGVLGSGDRAVAERLEAAWFQHRGHVAEKEREPDRDLIRLLVDRGTLYDELDDETALRMDRLVILCFELTLGAVADAFAPMRDDMQLLVRTLRESGKAGGIVPLLDHLCNGRRFGASERPIDVPHYSYLEATEVEALRRGLAEVLGAAQAKGFLARLTGGGLKLRAGQDELVANLARILEGARGGGLEIFSANRDPEARWDVA